MSEMTSALLRAAAFMDCSTLTVRHLTTLLLLAESPAPVKHRELADQLDVPRPAMTRIVDALSKARLVERHQNKADGRDRLLVLSPRGRDIAAKIQPISQRRAA